MLPLALVSVQVVSVAANVLAGTGKMTLLNGRDSNERQYFGVHEDVWEH